MLKPIFKLLDFQKKGYLGFKEFNILVRNINSKQYTYAWCKSLFYREADL